MAGRALKWHPERVARVLEALSAGLTQELAAAYAGISVDTLERWRQGKQGADADFAERYRRAEVAGSFAAVVRIRQAMPDDWRAAAWLLEHRYPQHYGKQVLEHQGKDGSAITFTLTLDRPTEDADGGR